MGRNSQDNAPIERAYNDRMFEYLLCAVIRLAAKAVPCKSIDHATHMKVIRLAAKAVPCKSIMLLT